MGWIKNLFTKDSKIKVEEEKGKLEVTVTKPDKDGVAYICVNGLITDTPVVVFPPEMAEEIQKIIVELTKKNLETEK